MTTSAVFRLTEVIRKAFQAPELSQHTQQIVDGICSELDIDVCSIYKLDVDSNLSLISSHGLSTEYPILIPDGKGLVGKVVRSSQIINISNPSSYPEYFFVPSSGEDEYQNFCGIPLIHHSKVIGVLVVQNKSHSVFDEQILSILITLAGHLSVVLFCLLQSSDAYDSEKRSLTLKGVSGAPGLAIGSAFFLQTDALKQVRPEYGGNYEEELESWESLRAKTNIQFENERESLANSLGENFAVLIDAYQLVLHDHEFNAYIDLRLREGCTLLWAIKQTVNYFSDQFLAISDPYFQAKHEDILHLGNKLCQVHSQNRFNSESSYNVPESLGVLCGDNISVSDIASLPSRGLSAVVCSEGAALSHVAVFANAIGIPAIMGVGQLTFGSSDVLIVDGDNGELFINPPKYILSQFRGRIEERSRLKQVIGARCHLPAVSSDGQEVIVMANSGLQSDILPGIENGADGIGLYRTELPFMIHDKLPTEEEQVRIYKAVVDAYDGKSVCFRLLDVGGDKTLAYMPEIHEENPALGLRGIRYLLDNELILRTQIRAILKTSPGKNSTRLLIPMLTNTNELVSVRSILNDEINRLKSEGINVFSPSLGVMVEVPCVSSMLPFWAEHIDFVSIGSNDLSQYLLAVDRTNSQVGRRFDVLHPAVLHEIKRIVVVSDKLDLPVSLCGEMASDPVSILFLLGLGIRNFSMSASRIPAIKWLVKKLDIDSLSMLVERALAMDSAENIRILGQEYLLTVSDEARDLFGI